MPETKAQATVDVVLGSVEADPGSKLPEPELEEANVQAQSIGKYMLSKLA